MKIGSLPSKFHGKPILPDYENPQLPRPIGNALSHHDLIFSRLIATLYRD